MQAGDPATDNDVWLRPVTNSSHLKGGGSRIHHGELKKWLGPPDDAAKPWKLELSGRLLSLANSISADAKSKVDRQRQSLNDRGLDIPSSIQYCGVLYRKVADVRAIIEMTCDVIFEPTGIDPAHANIVVMDRGRDQILTVGDFFATFLTLVPAQQVASHPTLGNCA